MRSPAALNGDDITSCCADAQKNRCALASGLLCLVHLTLVARVSTSRSCHLRIHALQQAPSLFDHLGEGEQRHRQLKIECFGRATIDH
jgi:hypothetical protein